jgi:hypothetical protein
VEGWAGVSDERLEKIRALLAKAEATPFPEEAETFNTKASELMAKYSIDEAMLARDRGDGSAPGELVVVVHRPYTAQKALLVCEVARCFGCRGVRFLGGPGSTSEEVRVVGFPVDLELVETLVTSLLVQLSGSMLRSQPAFSSAAGSAAWRRSFISGVVGAVIERLESRRAAVIVDVTEASTTVGSPSVALVLADRAATVEDEFRRRHPHLRISRVSSGSSRHGHAAGQVAGRTADLGGDRLGASRSLTA